MRIDETECLIVCERDALTGWSDGRYCFTSFQRQRCGQVYYAIEIEVARRELCQRVEPFRKIAVFAGLYQSQMPFRQCNVLIAWYHPEHGNCERRQRISNQRAVAITANTIEDHPGDVHCRIM